MDKRKVNCVESGIDGCIVEIEAWPDILKHIVYPYIRCKYNDEYYLFTESELVEV